MWVVNLLQCYMWLVVLLERSVVVLEVVAVTELNGDRFRSG